MIIQEHELKHLLDTNTKAAFLIGQTMGSLLSIMQNCDYEPVRSQLALLHKYITDKVDELYYE